MIIKDMFAKPIDRDIKGVIKVGQDDNANIQQELEEYVVTRELQKHFRDFFASYKRGINGETDKMGVWISGFFGSGKSHFLKILSYLLENKEVNGKRAIDYFIEDNKIADPMVLADMKLAANVPTDVVLFNIDSKSDVDAKQSKVAIISVLHKVFNEMQGYCASNPFLADLERNLDDSGKFEEFKQKFEENNGSEWTEAREEFYFIQDEIVETLAEIGYMSEESSRIFCEKAAGEYPYQIESFANLVNKYIEKKGNNHHVVFLIDEIGQYIGDDSKLMLNLQTVTENLGTFCGGKAWIIVTSQQDIDSITKTKGNDFSKIQGRFDTRLSLSSANVDEVIKKRILAKNKTGKQTLEILYENKATIIKNLIVFNDGIEKKLYSSKEGFADVYPFIPYQFNLLGSVLTSIRIHGASGKHLAEGERSMLALFKESAMKIMQQEPGVLVPFNRFYDALEKFIDHSHSTVITKALDNNYINPDKKDDCFDVNVLKTLFMIKYVKEIEPNIENITSLMVSNINEDRIALKEKVESALKRLERQTLVQKNADKYIFLTNEEQEINREISSQNVEIGEITGKVAEMIFEGIYPEKKYTSSSFNKRYSFAFNRYLDDKTHGALNADINLRVLTPYSDERGDDAAMKMLSSRENSVIVVLPDDKSFMDEIKASIQIEKFLRRDSANTTTGRPEIKEAKKSERTERQKLAEVYLEEGLKEAGIFVLGEKVQVNSKDIKTKINEAMSKLVGKLYHKLSYIDTPMSDSDIHSILKAKSSRISFDGLGKEENKLALNDLKNFISGNKMKYLKTSMKSVNDYLSKAPYGFVDLDIQWLVAKLFKDKEISMSVNNEEITLINRKEEDIFRYITRKEFAEKLMLDIKERVSTKKKKLAKDLMKDLFDFPCSSDDDEEIMREFLRLANNLKNDIIDLEMKYTDGSKYPGRETIREGKKLFTELTNEEYTNSFFNEIEEKEEDYLDFMEEYEPIKTFFSGDQKAMFDKSVKILNLYEESKFSIVNENLEEIESAVKNIKDIIYMEKPYDYIFKLPGYNDIFNSSYGELLDNILKPIEESIEAIKKYVFEELADKKCHDILASDFLQIFEGIKNKAEKADNVAELNSIKVAIDDIKSSCIKRIDIEERKIAQREEEERIRKEREAAGNTEVDTSTVKVEPIKPVVETKKYTTIQKVSNTMSWQIRNEEDVKKYVAELEANLLKTLKEMDEDILNVSL